MISQDCCEPRKICEGFDSTSQRNESREENKGKGLKETRLKYDRTRKRGRRTFEEFELRETNHYVLFLGLLHTYIFNYSTSLVVYNLFYFAIVLHMH